MRVPAEPRRPPPACQAPGAADRYREHPPPRSVSGRCRRRAARPVAASKSDREAFLSDLIAFQSDERDGKGASRQGGGRRQGAQELVDRATRALDSARAALERRQEQFPSRPADSLFTYASNREDVRTEQRTDQQTRSQLADALAADDVEALEGAFRQESGGAPWQLERQPQQPEPERRQLDFAEPSAAFLDFISQDAQDAEAAKSKTLPPFQSVLELTSAAAPPQRGGEAGSAAAAAAVPSGLHSLADGEGRLADGTRFVRESGEERGRNGYWHRWTRLRGVSGGGRVEWEERWWEASDWAGMKELGAEKSGCAADGSAWRETWREAIGFDEASGEPLVERSAAKWAADARGDEWEEKWGEHYWSRGRARKWADKWGKDGGDVWHERWGEEYPGGDACFKYTDRVRPPPPRPLARSDRRPSLRPPPAPQWAERRVEGGGLEQWGDKWEEDFAGGRGGKKGETWSVGAGGERYQRWWGEAHAGDGWVQKFGNSSTGERWDVRERMDTYYNPVPHFGFQLALDHSPTLKYVATLPRVTDDLGEGMDSL